MYTEYEVRQVPLRLASSRRQVEQFLVANGLRLDDDVDYMAAVYNLEGEDIVACGALQGNLIKCVAVDGSMREEGLSSRLISHLIATAYRQGYTTVRLFTKPSNQQLFQSLGFMLLAQAPQAILMENNARPLREYCQQLREHRRPGCCGVVVMNANPFTRGHRYLIEQAAQRVDHLFIIPVREDRSLFSYVDRRAMLCDGTRDMTNVTVLQGSDYVISALSFPTYFLKDLNDATDTHITLDLDLFVRHIVPALEVRCRFVGSEPTDALTRRYNELMHQLLPPCGIQVLEVTRLTDDRAQPVSASSLRRCLQQGDFYQASRLAYRTTVPYVLAQVATQALQQELNLTPKPGLVDRDGSGAHCDMDYALMQRSIDALHPYFVQLAQIGYTAQHIPSVKQLQALGVDAERSMLAATHGVNTHRGALFSMGLTVCAAAYLQATVGYIDATRLHTTISAMARQFPMPGDTHGAQVVNRYRVKGALATATEGYPELFSLWLPYYRQHREEQVVCAKLLLLIMSTLDDTNVYHRCGADTAVWLRQRSRDLLDHFSLNAYSQFCAHCDASNISPGGSADMFSLTLFVWAVCEENE